MRGWLIGTLCLALLACSGSCGLADLLDQSATTPATSGTPERPAAPRRRGKALDAGACQAMLNEMEDLTAGLRLPPHFRSDEAVTEGPVRTGDEFDVSRYFTVLEHLSMEPGYALDYVYYNDGMGGAPVLYGRRTDEEPYATYNEFLQARAGEIEDGCFYCTYLDHVQVDDTPEGYLEYVILRTMGDQFYLWWHASYNDTRILCNKEGLKRALTAVDDFGAGIDMTNAVKRKARRLNLTPTVALEEDRAIVRVVTFTKWGGFIAETYTIDRNFPHKILDIERETLVEYDCQLAF